MVTEENLNVLNTKQFCPISEIAFDYGLSRQLAIDYLEALASIDIAIIKSNGYNIK